MLEKIRTECIMTLFLNWRVFENFKFWKIIITIFVGVTFEGFLSLVTVRFKLAKCGTRIRITLIKNRLNFNLTYTYINKNFVFVYFRRRWPSTRHVVGGKSFCPTRGKCTEGTSSLPGTELGTPIHYRDKTDARQRDNFFRLKTCW